MIVKTVLKNLGCEIGRRNNLTKFAINEFYFPTEEEEIENLEVGETYISITGQLIAE